MYVLMVFLELGKKGGGFAKTGMVLMFPNKFRPILIHIPSVSLLYGISAIIQPYNLHQVGIHLLLLVEEEEWETL